MPSLSDLGKLALDYGPALAGPVTSGILQRSAAGSATNKLDEGAARAEAVIQPYSDVGRTAVSKLANFGLDEMMQDPGLRWRVQEGDKLFARQQASTGSLNSGAAWKAREMYRTNLLNQEFDRAYNRTERQADMGLRASGQLVDLMTARASALAAGDVAKANALTDMIGGIQKGIEGVQDMKTLSWLLGIGGTAAKATGMLGAGTSLLGTAGGTIGPTLGGTQAIQAATMPGLLAGAPTTALAGPGTAAATGIGGSTTAGATTGVATGGGLTGTLAALATNPITWAVGAGILGAVAWKKSQAHHEANTWVQGNQNPFDLAMANTRLAVDSGAMTPEQGQVAEQENVKAYLTELMKFMEGGSDETTVGKQALETFKKYYGDPEQYGFTGFNEPTARQQLLNPVMARLTATPKLGVL